MAADTDLIRITLAGSSRQGTMDPGDLDYAVSSQALSDWMGRRGMDRVLERRDLLAAHMITLTKALVDGEWPFTNTLDFAREYAATLPSGAGEFSSEYAAQIDREVAEARALIAKTFGR